MPTPRIKRTRNGNIQGDNVTLDFDAAVVSPETFRRAINAFLDLVKAVSEKIASTGKKIQWDIKVATGSRLLIAAPVADPETTRSSQRALDAIRSGLKTLERGSNKVPSYFDERALRAVRDLAALREDNLKGLSYVRVRSTGAPCNIGEKSAASVQQLLEGQRQALGSVEGHLQTISDRGSLQFVVYDDLYDKGVNCFMDDRLVAEAVKAWRKRVIVSGMVQYAQDGRPASIRVDKIRVFKDEIKLPHHRALRGIFKKAR